jgi:hypothetical protein
MTTPLDINTAPKDGTRILLHYHVMHYIGRAWQRNGTKWEECRWKETHMGSPAHWEPWCGNPRTRTTDHINPDSAIEWIPLPSTP